MSGQSNSEIAEGLSISIPAVKSRLYRSRRFLKTRMSEYMPEVIARPVQGGLSWSRTGKVPPESNLILGWTPSPAVAGRLSSDEKVS